MIDFWNTKQHPVTLFRDYPSGDISKNKPENALKEIEIGIAIDRQDKYVAVYFFGTNAKKTIGRFNTIEEAREAYKQYMKIKSNTKGVAFSHCKGRFYVKHEGVNKNFMTELEAKEFLKTIQ